MARRVFFSFHYARDFWRTSQVREIGALEKNTPVSDNDWEAIKAQGDAAIKRWIDNQLSGKSCAIVLIGTQTAQRRWVKYEIQRAWEAGKGVLGIHIHRLKDQNGEQCAEGENPLTKLPLTRGDLSKTVHNPSQTTSKGVYGHIEQHIADWVETAIAVRKEYQ